VSTLPSWLLVPGLAGTAGRVVLPQEAAHHLARVCRARAGDHVTATDGAGTVADLELESVTAVVAARVVALGRLARPSQAWVLCGAPEGTRGDWLVEKLAELGVARFQPLDCDRAVWRGARLDRWSKLAAAALGQSRQAWLMEVAAPATIERALAAVPPGASCWLASAGGKSLAAPPKAPAMSVVAVGPASGFGAGEIQALEARGFTSIRLARSRLRTETAALAWAGIWAARTASEA